MVGNFCRPWQGRALGAEAALRRDGAAPAWSNQYARGQATTASKHRVSSTWRRRRFTSARVDW